MGELLVTAEIPLVAGVRVATFVRHRQVTPVVVQPVTRAATANLQHHPKSFIARKIFWVNTIKLEKIRMNKVYVHNLMTMDDGATTTKIKEKFYI